MAEKKPLPDWVRNWGTFVGLLLLVLLLSWSISLLGNFQNEGRTPSSVGGQGALVLGPQNSSVEILGEEEMPTWEVQIMPAEPTTEVELVARLALIDENGPPLPAEEALSVHWTRDNKPVPKVKGWRVSPELTDVCELWQVVVTADGKRSVAMVTVLPGTVPEVAGPEAAERSGTPLIPTFPAGIKVETRAGIAALRHFVRIDVRMGKRPKSTLGGILVDQPHLGVLLEAADKSASALYEKKGAETIRTAMSIVEARDKLRALSANTDEALPQNLMPVQVTVADVPIDVLSADAIVSPDSPDMEQAWEQLREHEAELLKPGSVSQRQLTAISNIAVYVAERDRILGCMSGG
jgi:hypothetical protein